MILFLFHSNTKSLSSPVAFKICLGTNYTQLYSLTPLIFRVYLQLINFLKSTYKHTNTKKQIGFLSVEQTASAQCISIFYDDGMQKLMSKVTTASVTQYEVSESLI